MTGKRVTVFTLTFRDGRVESFKFCTEGQHSVHVSRPEDEQTRETWEHNGIVGRRYPWHVIESIDHHPVVVECSAEDPCWGADCERCRPRAEEADILVHGDGSPVGDPRREQEQVHREITV